MKLDFQGERFENLMNKAASIVRKWYDQLETTKVYHNHSAKEIFEHFDEKMPEEGIDIEALLKIVESDIFDRSNLNIHPNYYAYITGGGNQVAIIAELLRTALNQNNLKWHSAPANTEIEKIVLHWISEFIGYGTDSIGVLASGGAVANFLAMAVARKNMAPFDIAEEGLAGGPKMVYYASAEGHSSIDKGADMLGIGRKYVRKIPAKADYTINTTALITQIEADKKAGLLPICVVGIAGTTNTGAIDPLDELADICAKYNLWFHVDAAYGGPAAKSSLSDWRFKGMDRADSLIINPHKWLFIPFEAAALLVRKESHLRNTFSLIPPYLRYGQDEHRTDLMEYNLQLTKDFKALKIWMTFKAYGAKAIRTSIDRDIELARYLESQILASDDFELLAPVHLSIVCFRYNPNSLNLNEEQLNKINRQILEEIEADGRVFFTGTQLNGKTSLRACCINHRREKKHIDILMTVIREISEKCSNYRFIS